MTSTLATSATLDILDNIDTQIAFFRFKKMKDGDYLITNDVGKYAYLTPEEFQNFLVGTLRGEKKYELTEKLFYTSPQYEDEMIKLYNQKHQFIAFGPSLHMIVTTLRCTHKCRYCHAAVAPMSATHLNMTLETAKKVVDTIFYSSAPSVTIEFQGGESLANWEVVQFVVEYSQHKSSILGKKSFLTLVSNLSLMTEEKMLWLLDHQVSICTSLDGDELIHNSQRVWKDDNSYKKVTYWIERIRNEKLKRGMSTNAAQVGALTTWTKTSICEYKKVIDTFVENGILSIGFRYLNPYGFACVDKKELAFSPKEFQELYCNGMDYILELNKKGYKLREMISSVYLGKILLNRDGWYTDIRSPGGSAIGAVAYNYDGKVYASDEARMLGRMGIEDFCMTPLLETGEQTYRAMANSSVTKVAVSASTTDGLPGYNEHAYKPYMGVCLEYNFTEYGTIYSNFTKDERNQMQIATLDYLFEKLKDPENERIFHSWFE